MKFLPSHGRWLSLSLGIFFLNHEKLILETLNCQCREPPQVHIRCWFLGEQFFLFPHSLIGGSFGLNNILDYQTRSSVLLMKFSSHLPLSLCGARAHEGRKRGLKFSLLHKLMFPTASKIFKIVWSFGFKLILTRIVLFQFKMPTFKLILQ